MKSEQQILKAIQDYDALRKKAKTNRDFEFFVAKKQVLEWVLKP